ncbi:type II CAAX endopeptidase family protein [Clostridium cibarium]|uniref:CPBP family intramembrane metalloprotease n=1 Tax=Clostridium cibarium TaxID=2762247 RepID=A0ABR8PV71_9CLOT|nr:type II CAAX endopeptidase family protein [Clostridium cibarium]MBD7912060.1 CPBP family intramembrane metalloprotease [Clostridium cibarium]
MIEVLKSIKYRHLIFGSIVTFIISLVCCKLLYVSSYMSASISVTLALYIFPTVLIFYKFSKFKISIKVWLKVVRFKIVEIFTSGIFSQVLGLGILFLLTAIITLIFPMDGQSDPINIPTNWVETFVSACIFAPFCEEIIFRGLIFNKLLVKYSPAKAIVISSVIFGAMHLTKGITPAILGGVLCILYMKYKSLIPGMVIHCLNNFGIELLKYLTFGNSIAESEVKQPGTLPVFIFSIICIIVGLLWLVNFIKKNWHYTTEFISENTMESEMTTFIR